MTAPEDPVVPPTVHRNASWGALISMIVIMAMIVVGAFYAWGKRLREENGYTAAAAAQSITATTTIITTY